MAGSEVLNCPLSVLGVQCPVGCVYYIVIPIPSGAGAALDVNRMSGLSTLVQPHLTGCPRDIKLNSTFGFRLLSHWVEALQVDRARLTPTRHSYNRACLALVHVKDRLVIDLLWDKLLFEPIRLLYNHYL